MKIQKRRFEFTPFSKKQLQVLSWWANPKLKDRETIVCDGSVRAGKTVVMSLSYILWSMINFNGQQFGLAGKTIGSFRRNVLRPLKNMLESEGFLIHDSRSENLLTITKNGHTNYYFIFGGKDEASQDLVQGITLAGFFFDEVALMPQSFVNQATARCSVDGSKLWFNCNPEGPYHWFKLEWIDQIEQKKGIRIHFTMEDNPSLSQSVIDRYNRMYSGVFYKRFIMGLWVLADGVVYDNFDPDTMVVDPPEDAVWEENWIGIDYGTQNATTYKLWSLYKGVWYNRGEYYYSGRETGRQKTDEQYVDDLEDFYLDNGLTRSDTTLIVDPSAASFKRALKNRDFKVVNANNDVITGIRFMMTQMNEGKMKWTPVSVHTIKEFNSYVWDEKAAEHGIDAVVKEHDHCLVGNTLVDTVDGQKRIKDLVGKTGKVFAVDQKNNKRVVAKFNKVRRTQTNAEIYRLTLANGLIIEGTKTHPVLTQRGWIPLGEVRNDDKVVRIQTSRSRWHKIYQRQKNRLLSFIQKHKW